MNSLSVQELRERSLGRQFPKLPNIDLPSLLARIGPIQSQTPRSVFIGAAARSELDHEQIHQDLDQFGCIRATTLRGTIHTTGRTSFEHLGATAAHAQQRSWTRSLKLSTKTPREVAEAVMTFAAHDWKTVDEIHSHLVDWLRREESEESAEAVINESGRYLTYGHIGLLRRPANGAWNRTGPAEFRSSRTLGLDPYPPHGEVLTDTFLNHLRWHGPASAHDVSWWSGANVTDLGKAASALIDAGQVEQFACNDVEYFDVVDEKPGSDVPQCAFLPEFDALLCAFHPQRRNRFLRTRDAPYVWNRGNGLCRPLLFFDGQIGGVWTTNTARKSQVDATVALFPGFKNPGRRALKTAFASLSRVMQWTLRDLTITRASIMTASPRR